MTAPPSMWLSGATEGVQIPSEQDLRAVFHLMSCPTHINRAGLGFGLLPV